MKRSLRASIENFMRGIMQLRDNGLRFSRVTLTLHWIGALLVLGVVLIELVLVFVPATGITELIQLENLFGLTLCIVSGYRLWARLTTFHPLPCGTPNPVEVIVSRSVAVALTLAGVLLPIAAWISKSAGGELIDLPGGLALPPIASTDYAMKGVIDVIFTIGASAFMAGLTLHIFGALKNHFILKNDTLRRMCGKKVEF
jgi:superoxide oxidase